MHAASRAHAHTHTHTHKKKNWLKMAYLFLAKTEAEGTSNLTARGTGDFSPFSMIFAAPHMQQQGPGKPLAMPLAKPLHPPPAQKIQPAALLTRSGAL
jgi:hypothetical protein